MKELTSICIDGDLRFFREVLNKESRDILKQFLLHPKDSGTSQGANLIHVVCHYDRVEILREIKSFLGDEEFEKELLKPKLSGPDEGSNALHVVCWYGKIQTFWEIQKILGDEKIVEELLKPKLSGPDQSSNAIHIVCRHGGVEIFQEIKKILGDERFKKELLNPKSFGPDQGANAINSACQNSEMKILHEIKEILSEEIFKEELLKSLDSGPGMGANSIHLICRDGNVKTLQEVRNILGDKKFEEGLLKTIESGEGQGVNALHIACRYGRKEILQEIRKILGDRKFKEVLLKPIAFGVFHDANAVHIICLNGRKVILQEIRNFLGDEKYKEELTKIGGILFAQSQNFSSSAYSDLSRNLIKFIDDNYSGFAVVEFFCKILRKLPNDIARIKFVASINFNKKRNSYEEASEKQHLLEFLVACLICNFSINNKGIEEFLSDRTFKDQDSFIHIKPILSDFAEIISSLSNLLEEYYVENISEKQKLFQSQIRIAEEERKIILNNIKEVFFNVQKEHPLFLFALKNSNKLRSALIESLKLMLSLNLTKQDLQKAVLDFYQEKIHSFFYDKKISSAIISLRK